MTVPEAEDAKEDADDAREREALLKVHEIAAAWFREQLSAPAGARPRCAWSRDRGMTAETIAMLGIGYAPNAGGCARGCSRRVRRRAAAQERPGRAA